MWSSDFFMVELSRQTGMCSHNLKCFSHNTASFRLSHSFSFSLLLVKRDSAVHPPACWPYLSLWKLMHILIKCPNLSCLLSPPFLSSFMFCTFASFTATAAVCFFLLSLSVDFKWLHFSSTSSFSMLAKQWDKEHRKDSTAVLVLFIHVLCSVPVPAARTSKLLW